MFSIPTTLNLQSCTCALDLPFNGFKWFSFLSRFFICILVVVRKEALGVGLSDRILCELESISYINGT